MPSPTDSTAIIMNSPVKNLVQGYPWSSEVRLAKMSFCVRSNVPIRIRSLVDDMPILMVRADIFGGSGHEIRDDGKGIRRKETVEYCPFFSYR